PDEVSRIQEMPLLQQVPCSCRNRRRADSGIENPLKDGQRRRRPSLPRTRPTIRFCRSADCRWWAPSLNRSVEESCLTVGAVADLQDEARTAGTSYSPRILAVKRDQSVSLQAAARVGRYDRWHRISP